MDYGEDGINETRDENNEDMDGNNTWFVLSRWPL